jgi:hypothetical protein
MKPTQVPPQKTEQPLDGAWLAVGIGVGTALGVAFDNLAVGLGLGVTFGLIIPMIKWRRKEEEGKAKEDDGAQPKQ